MVKKQLNRPRQKKKRKWVCCAIKKQFKLRQTWLWKKCGKLKYESFKSVGKIKGKNKNKPTTARLFDVV